MAGRRFIAACAAPGFAAVLSGRDVAVRDDKYACDGDGDGDDFARANLFVEDGDAEGVGEEGGAVVYCCEVAGCGLVDGDVPAAARECEGARDEGCHFDHVAYGADELLAGRGVQGLVLHCEGDLAEELGMAAPEEGEGGGVGLEAEEEEHDGVEDDPGAVGHVAVVEMLVLHCLVVRMHVGKVVGIVAGRLHTAYNTASPISADVGYTRPSLSAP